MSDNPLKDVVYELIPYFERLETETGALMQLLTDKGLVSSEELNRYLEQASRASEVKWRAARVRVERLASPGSKAAESGSKAVESGSQIHDRNARDASTDHSKETPENLAHDPSSGDRDSKQNQRASQSTLSNGKREEEGEAPTAEIAGTGEEPQKHETKAQDDVQPHLPEDRKKVDTEKSENAA